MKFFDKLFGKDPKNTGSIRVGKPMMLSQEIGEQIEALITGRAPIQEDRQAILLTKDHPELKTAFDSYQDFRKFLDKQAEDIHDNAKTRLEELDKKHNEYSEMIWSRAEEYMRAHDMWPLGYERNKTNDDVMCESRGVVYRIKRIEKKSP